MFSLYAVSYVVNERL